MSNSSILLQSLQTYYDETPKRMKTILPIMTSTNTDISIRLIDWFVTNYSKKMNVVYKVPNKEEPIVVWQDYKSQLKGWSKKFFDPFCRRERILFKYKDGSQTNEIMTTLGQLNFFRWAIENKILDYIKKNLKEIEQDMVSNCKYEKKQSGEKTRRKRRELSISASKTVNKHNVVLTLKFN
jgi:hypothetical protein